MKKVSILIYCCLSILYLSAQNNLQKAYQQFEDDSQLKHATSSLYVIDAATGKVVFDKNSQVGLAPASTQKIITTATAFDLLGKDFRYKTEFGYYGKINKDTLKGILFVKPSGDPTFGSWRYQSTKDSFIFNEFIAGLRKSGIKNIYGGPLDYNHNGFSKNVIPDGWIWEDIGNYYGAYTDILNWKENQHDIALKSGDNAGDPVEIVTPSVGSLNELKTGAKGSGDNAYAYMTYSGKELLTGTIPPNEKAFKISTTQWGSAEYFLHDLSEFISSQGIERSHNAEFKENHTEEIVKREQFKTISTHYSPSLDSIVYWFLKKSINLYGESLVKTLAHQNQGFGSTDSGVAIVKKYWKDKGFDVDELNIRDGSGLSPLNRVTTHAQVEILKYAKTRDWFPYFYNALPEYNGMKMKSGTISDVKAFCGYQKASDGKEYIFSFIVNNFNGKTSELVGKMYKVLDNLK